MLPPGTHVSVAVAVLTARGFAVSMRAGISHCRIAGSQYFATADAAGSGQVPVFSWSTVSEGATGVTNSADLLRTWPPAPRWTVRNVFAYETPLLRFSWMR